MTKVYEFADIFGREFGYPNRNALARRIRNFMNTTAHGHKLTTKEYFYFLALFEKYHPDAGTNVFENVEDILRVDTYTYGKKTKALTLLYADGRPPRELSWLSCLRERCDDPLKSIEVRITLKNIIRKQLDTYRDYRVSDGSLECDVHGAVPPSQIKVEHHNPPFIELVRRWYEGVGSPDLVLCDKDRSRFSDEKITRSWWNFHRKYANLRLICNKQH